MIQTEHNHVYLSKLYHLHRPHPKDGEGNVFTLFDSPNPDWGGGGCSPSPSHNASTGPMSFQGEGTPVPGGGYARVLPWLGQDGVPPGQDWVPPLRCY